MIRKIYDEELVNANVMVTCIICVKYRQRISEIGKCSKSS